MGECPMASLKPQTSDKYTSNAYWLCVGGTVSLSTLLAKWKGCQWGLSLYMMVLNIWQPSLIGGSEAGMQSSVYLCIMSLAITDWKICICHKLNNGMPVSNLFY